jgi:diadenosine tetraphosphatase ApaH/serine/threonine PP2A family protein phosphatase
MTHTWPKTALISDVHANLEALLAVLADIETRDCERIFCLGDAINYGPDPVRVLELVERLDLMLMGNHEEAVLHEPIGFNPQAAQAAKWTRSVLLPGVLGGQGKRKHWAFIEQRPYRHEEDDVLLVHASPREPTSEYLLPRDGDRLMGEPTEKLAANFQLIKHLCFVGHTHIPGVFTETSEFASPSELESEYRVEPGTKAIINVGSTGQPRDHINQACYVTYDGEVVAFHRVPYDVETTCRKIKAIKGLPDRGGERLLLGE